MQNFLKLCEELNKDIQNAYEAPITIADAERLAVKFLSAQMRVAGELQIADLDARMRKSGTKAIKAAVYMEAVGKVDKKPSDSYLEQIVNMNELVASEQKAYDEAEVYRDALQNYLNVFKEAHVFFRQVSKGAYNG